MDNVNFEDALKRLETIVEQLESGQLSLEESLDIFEEGVKLAVSCQQELRRADGRVKRLVKRINGDFELQDFEE
ncbi:MAG TPA: exodeoxyribonuclease VII small subunit [Syntrophomonas sp.]|jgi:exodeoxyribonuclease VII small subunit|nr:exodeoxyribonuclease VII small subunit [Syntrophomonas sp.]HCF71791.1 exodeoxyribonuclease VII small subunit [Syntrophomonas sp.]